MALKPSWGLLDLARIGDTVESLKLALVRPTVDMMTQVRTMLGGGLTFGDNFKCAIIERPLVHGVELPITLGFRPIGVYALRSNALGTNPRYAIDSFDWQPDVPGGTIGVTARFDQRATGYIGEAARSYVPFGSRVAIAPSTTVVNVTSIVLTPGDWLISALCGFGGAALTGTALYAGINTVSATLPTDYGDNIAESVVMPTAGVSSYISIPSYRVVPTATTTYRLVASAVFAAGSTGAFGRISAVRASKLDAAVSNTVTLLCVGG